jgi:hypothetical protein
MKYKKYKWKADPLQDPVPSFILANLLTYKIPSYFTLNSTSEALILILFSIPTDNLCAHTELCPSNSN